LFGGVLLDEAMPSHSDNEVKVEVIVELVRVFSEIRQRDSRLEHRACNLDCVDAVPVHPQQEYGSDRVGNHLREVTSDFVKRLGVRD
jgi:hypothetical protein